MPNITVDGKQIETRDGVNVLQAVLEAGWDVPHYCYHPGLKVVASCRLCLMEMKMPHPKTKELSWAPKLFPACQTPVKDGMEVRFDSDNVRNNVKHVMEYYLLNHPLDCPVCDKAGECYLQDYTEDHGPATSRMVEDKHKNPKKDIGSKTLLYQDRCVLCTRCVRFADEVAGAAELTVVNRGSRNEIDVFPGTPLENPLQGNVVDLCPVGALLDKEFLFKHRVWRLKSTKSISPVDSSGQAIYIDHDEGEIKRIRPRFNEKVNQWWISDEARFGWKFVHNPERLDQPLKRDGGELKPTSWDQLHTLLREKFTRAAQTNDGASVAAVLSPFMACEEAWLLAKTIRELAPQATLVLGPVPTEGDDQTFPKGFVIRGEKCPNRRGVETIIKHLGGPTASLDEFSGLCERKKFIAAYVYGGYPQAWLEGPLQAALAQTDLLVAHDLFAAAWQDLATVLIPSASWAEREGTFMNFEGLVQPFERAIAPLDGVKFDGQFLYEFAGQTGLYRGRKVREQLAAEIPAFGEVFEPRKEPDYAH